jgi:antitoxin VapB
LVREAIVALNIKSDEVERLVDEVVRLSGDTKTAAVRRALAERRERLVRGAASTDRGGRLRRFLEREAWPRVPADELGTRLTREEEDAILGYGVDGV